MVASPKFCLAEKAMCLFQRCGLRACTMEDVSRELAISKKTLYKFFSNKTELVDESVRAFFTKNTQRIEEITGKSANALDEIMKIHAFVLEVMKSNGPAMIFAMRKYYPETHQWLMEHRKEFVIKQVTANIKRGISEGLYRNDLPVEQVVWHHYLHLVAAIDMEILPKHLVSNPEFLEYGMHSFVRSIVSEKGGQFLMQNNYTLI